MRHGSLFNGIGGFQLAAHWMGWENIFHCEIDKFCNQVVKRHFPESICYEDIKKTDFTPWKGAIDILTGGFPCQPYSLAGKRKGNQDDRHLWPEMLRAIREVFPRWIVGENVRGLTNWKGGMVFDQVQADLETEGYEVLPFLLPAAGVGAPHERYRIWFVAYSYGQRKSIGPGDAYSGPGILGASSDTRRQPCNGGEGSENGCFDYGKDEGWEKKTNIFGGLCSERSASYSDSKGFQERLQSAAQQYGKQKETSPGRLLTRNHTASDWSQFPTVSPVSGGNDGIPNRVDRIRAVGNAIVPQIALEIFKAIEAFENP